MISILLSGVRGEKGSTGEGKGRGGATLLRMGGKYSSLTRMPLPAAFQKRYLPACWLPRNACCAWNGCDKMHKVGPWKSGPIFVSK